MYQIKRGSKIRGPYSEETLINGIKDGRLLPSDLISLVDDDTWHSLDSFEPFSAFFLKNTEVQKKKTTNKSIENEDQKIKTTESNGFSRSALLTSCFVAFLIVLVPIVWKLSGIGNQLGEAADNQVYEVGTTVEVGELKVKLDWALIMNWEIVRGIKEFDELSDVPGLVLKIRIKTNDNTRKYNIRGAINSAKLIDNLGNRLNPLPAKTKRGTVLFWSEQLNSNQDFPVSSREEVRDFLVFEVPVKAADELICTIDSSVYGKKGFIKYRIPRTAWETPKENPANNKVKEEEFDLGRNNGMLGTNAEMMDRLLTQGDQKLLEKHYANIPGEKKKRAREFLVMKALKTDGQVQINALRFLAKVTVKEDGVNDQLVGLQTNPSSLIREAIFQYLCKTEQNPDKKYEYARAAVKDQNDRVALVGIACLTDLRMEKRGAALSELLNQCNHQIVAVRNKAESEILMFFKPMVFADIPILFEIKKDKSILTQRVIANVLGSFEQPNQDVIDALVGLSSNTEKPISIQAIKSLGGYGEKAKDSLPKLVEYQKNKDPDIRKEALLAIAKIATQPKDLGLVVAGIGDVIGDVSKACLEAVDNLMQTPGLLGFQAVEDKFDSQNQAIREVAYKVLESNCKGKQELAGTAIKGLDDKSELVQKLSLAFLQDLKTLDADGYKKLTAFLESHANKFDSLKLIPTCLRLLKNGKDMSKDAVPVLKTMLTANQKQEVRNEIYSLIEAIGPDASLLVDELMKNVTMPEIPRANPNLQNQKGKQEGIQINNLATYRKIFLESGENEKIRKAISFLGKPGAKEVAKYLSSQDPGIRFFALVALQSLGKDAKEQLPAVYKLTLGINEKVPFILQQAKESYGTIK